MNYPHSLGKIDQTYLNNADLQSHYILGAQKKRLIETGLLSAHNIRGHTFWLKIIKGNIPIFLRFKDKSFTMVSYIIMKEGSYSEPRFDV